METNNLMIGDWVQNQDGSIKGRIVNIDAYKNRVEFDAHTIDIEYVYPIPLTEEILYKNTFDEETSSYGVYSGNGFIQYTLGDKYVVRYYPDINKFIYEGIELKYVSDLQHLIKLIGINREIIL